MISDWFFYPEHVTNERRILLNTKISSLKLASQASKALNSTSTSAIQKSLAASVLSQRNRWNQTGAEMEKKASRILQSDKYSAQTKSFAASVLSQSNKER